MWSRPLKNVIQRAKSLGFRRALASALGGALINVTSPPLAAVQAARAHTLAAASARIELAINRNWEMPSMPDQRRGGLLRPLLSASKWTARKLLKAAAPNLDFRHQTAEGVIDMSRRRYMLDYGYFAVLYADGQEWGGRSGRAIATLPSDVEAVPTPLWLLDLLAGLTDTSDLDTEDVRGVPCRHLVGKADLSVASQATSAGVAVPARGRFEDLLALPIDVWVDSTHIRRVRFDSHQSVEHRTETLELCDFGVRLDDFDWTRLPTFRSPGEAEH